MTWRWLILALPFIVVAREPSRTQTAAWMGRIVTEWLPDGRRMRLVEEFAFVDSSGEIWRAPKGAEVDGSCLPSRFHRFLGDPFVGPQRNATVVHDVACHQRERGWRDVHRMFYNAARFGGVAPVDAKIMYFALYKFGPRWGSAPPDAMTTDEEFVRGARYIRMHPGVSLHDIEQMTAASLGRR